MKIRNLLFLQQSTEDLLVNLMSIRVATAHTPLANDGEASRVSYTLFLGIYLHIKLECDVLAAWPNG